MALKLQDACDDFVRMQHNPLPEPLTLFARFIGWTKPDIYALEVI